MFAESIPRFLRVTSSRRDRWGCLIRFLVRPPTWRCHFTLKLSTTVAVQNTPAVSSPLAYKTVQVALETTGIVRIFVIYIFVDFKPEHKPHPRSSATNLAGCTPQMFITATYRETNKQPNLQQAVALLTFTAQCFSYPSFFFFFFSRLSKPTTF